MIITPLDEARDFAACFLAAPDTVIDVIAAWSAHTHLLPYFYTSPRLLFWSDAEQAGKTEHESMALRLSANPWVVNNETSKDGLRARFDVSTTSMKPVIGIQEVSDIFGVSGRRGTSHPVNTYLRTGYKQGETVSVSRNGVSVDIDVYHACVMAGLRNAVPRDIRSRCIAVQCQPGEPPMYYKGREHDPMAADLRSSLSMWLRRFGTDAERYRLPRGLHPKLIKRPAELWEPLFAIAEIAGNDWPSRMLTAFREITAEQGNDSQLSPQHKILRDMAAAAVLLMPEGGAVAGSDLIREMRRTGESMYETLTDRSMAMFMARAMAPYQPLQFRAADGRNVRGYLMANIVSVAQARIPDSADEDQVPDMTPDAATLFDVTED